MSLKDFTKVVIRQNVKILQGTTASPIRMLHDDSNNFVYCVDVSLAGQDEPLRNVPIATNNRDIFYAEQGRAVELTVAGNNKWVVSGLAKSVTGLTHLIPLTFTDDGVDIGETVIKGYLVRPLSFGELGDLAPDGFGQFPFGAQARFDAMGNLIELL